jgi:4-hydroxy-4-methyl-2-oxoglutarate aldolase
MSAVAGFHDISPTTVADVLGREHVMDAGIRPLWPAIRRVAGPAFTVRCAPGDNLMLHAAIYRAEPGSVLVVESGDMNYALAGGNTCAIAQRRGIAALVTDGVIRDLADVREMSFPVFARGVIPAPGAKLAVSPLNGRVQCGGVSVEAGDIVVADEEGVAVVPAARREQVLLDAQARQDREAGESLDAWEESHHALVEKLLTEHGFVG